MKPVSVSGSRTSRYAGQTTLAIARIVVACAALLVSSIADATPRDDLKAANKAFREGNYPDARDKYNGLLYPEIQLADSNDLVEAYVNLGVCRLETGDEGGAKREFEKALQIDPNRQLDPLVITNKKAVALFDDTKTDIRVREEREKNARREAGEKERIRKLRAGLIGVQGNTKAYIAVPFGIGQFQNGDRKKGAFFLGAELVTVSTSVGIFAYLLNKYGIKSNAVPLEDGPRVRRLQQIEIGSGIAFYGLWIWGAVDAYRHYKPQVRVKLDESLLPPELRETPPPKKPKTPKTSYHLVPMLTPDGGAGIGIGWEN
ncbi:MAG TPA: tetratricopeptide repeat protein [Kofleriaceae bacterium]|nr:tetratricopeptide repeat protein [Kofleriaceae bacterium]